MDAAGVSVENPDGVVISTEALDVGSVGTGTIQPFLVVQDNGTEEGYNTDALANELPLDVKIAGQTRSILLSDLQVVTGPDGSGSYYVFFLDANESQGKDQYVSLSQFTLYSSSEPDQNGATVDGTELYTLDQDILVNSSISSGSGNGFDLAVYVPTSLIVPVLGENYLILYTEFGGQYDGELPDVEQGNKVIPAPYTSDGGNEEWKSILKSDTFVPDPSIAINKVTSAGDLPGGDDYTFLVGTAITWTYTVSNNGNVALTDITLTDDVLGDITDSATFTEQSGNGDDIFDIGEIWVFTMAGEATADDYSNIGTVTGNYGEEEVSAFDPSGYFGASPLISIDKVTVDETTDGDDLVILAGEDISWRYTVTNIGNVALSDIMVTDSDTGVTPVYVSGDFGVQGVMEVGETWIFSAVGEAISGDYENTGTASGSFTDSTGATKTDDDTDDSGYLGANPVINLDKVTQGADTTGTTHTGDGIVIQAGNSVKWIYTLTNDGNVGVTFDKATGIVDDGGPGASFNPVYVSGDTLDDGILGTGETWIFEKTGLATPGGYENSATATGSFKDTAGHVATPDDTDTSSYTGIFVADGRARTQGFWQSVCDAWDNVGGQANSTLAKFNSGELRDLGGDTILDVNPTAGAFLLLGDVNRNGLADDGCNLKIDLATAKNILASSTSGDARMIMLAQTIAAQLNIDNGVLQPNNLIKEAVQWLSGTGSWGGYVDVDVDNNGCIDTLNGKLVTSAANPVIATNGNAWQKYVDVTQQDATLNYFANGEGLKNALMWFNDGHLVTSLPNGTFVGWDEDGRGGSSVVTNWEFNTPDNFWLTLHRADTDGMGMPLGGIA